MSPILTLILAASLSGAESTREHVELIAAAIEQHASFELAAFTTESAAPPADIAFFYDLAAGASTDAQAPSTADPRARIIYSLESPIFRDLP